MYAYHKALEKMRRMTFFNNNRINSCVIEELDLYNRGEDMVDALDRLHESNESGVKAKCIEHGRNLKKIVWQKHAYNETGENYWKFDDWQNGEDTE